MAQQAAIIPNKLLKDVAIGLAIPFRRDAGKIESLIRLADSMQARGEKYRSKSGDQICLISPPGSGKVFLSAGYKAKRDSGLSNISFHVAKTARLKIVEILAYRGKYQAAIEQCGLVLAICKKTGANTDLATAWNSYCTGKLEMNEGNAKLQQKDETRFDLNEFTRSLLATSSNIVFGIGKFQKAAASLKQASELFEKSKNYDMAQVARSESLSLHREIMILCQAQSTFLLETLLAYNKIKPNLILKK